MSDKLSISGGDDDWVIFSKTVQSGNKLLFRSRTRSPAVQAFATANQMMRVRCVLREDQVAESRMPWVAMVYNPVPEPTDLGRAVAVAPKPPMQARYLAGLLSLDQLGLRLRKQAGQVGMEAADLGIALRDGGAGLEDFFRTNCNRAELVVIRDFWHAASYLEELALTLPPGASAGGPGSTRLVVFCPADLPLTITQ